jgi:hypothetical protein
MNGTFDRPLGPAFVGGTYAGTACVSTTVP